jgi:hypothetical protein
MKLRSSHQRRRGLGRSASLGLERSHTRLQRPVSVAQREELALELGEAVRDVAASGGLSSGERALQNVDVHVVLPSGTGASIAPQEIRVLPLQDQQPAPHCVRCDSRRISGRTALNWKDAPKMAHYLGHEIKLIEAIDVILNGVRTEGYTQQPTIDFGRQAIVLESDSEFDVSRGCTWSDQRADGSRVHRAVAEYQGDYDEVVKALTRGGRARVVTGSVAVPKAGAAQRKRGPIPVTYRRVTEQTTKQVEPPRVFRRDLVARISELEANLRPTTRARNERKQRETAAAAALREARAAFAKDASERNGDELERAATKLRREQLLSSVAVDSTQLDQQVAAARNELARLDGTQLWLGGVHAQPITFEQLYSIAARGAPGETWRARGERTESGFAVLAFDLTPMSLRDVLPRVRNRAIAHALPDGGWRIIVQLSRPATMTEAGLLAVVLGAKQFFEGAPFPDRGTAVLDLSDDPPLEVDATLAELEPVEAA